MIVGLAPAAERPPYGVVGEDHDAGRNTAVVANGQSTAAVKNAEWADPSMRTNRNITDDCGGIVDCDGLVTETPFSLLVPSD